jgi:uncharacterized protein YegP (UPF0339 family)
MKLQVYKSKGQHMGAKEGRMSCGEFYKFLNIMNHKIEIYRATNKQFYWRLVSRNGRIIADGAEGYKTRVALAKAVARLKVVDFTRLRVQEV